MSVILEGAPSSKVQLLCLNWRIPSAGAAAFAPQAPKSNMPPTTKRRDQGLLHVPVAAARKTGVRFSVDGFLLNGSLIGRSLGVPQLPRLLLGDGCKPDAAKNTT